MSVKSVAHRLVKPLFGRTVAPSTSAAANLDKRPPSDNPLEDSHGRHHTYLRISLTERCNLRCTYCMPEEGVPLTPNASILSAGEVIRLAGLFAANGVDKIRLTGGEPTIRRDLVEIVGQLAQIPRIEQVGITSNGIVLGRRLPELVQAGLSRLNISLDTLDERKYAIISRRNGFAKVMATMETAEKLFDPLKLNCVVMRGVNDDELCDFVELTRHRNLYIRFIEYMPFGGNAFKLGKMVPYKEMLAKIVSKFGSEGLGVTKLLDGPNDTSKAYSIDGFKGRFGFITSMSEHFCATCNRLRITADGNLKVCLHGQSEVSLRDKMRDGASDAELLAIISHAVRGKKAQHAGVENLVRMTNRAMILIGGRASMVDVTGKEISLRVALAVAFLQIPHAAMRHLLEREGNKKGDVLAVARTAGIQAAKQTSSLIPLCHNIPLGLVQINFKIEQNHKLVVFAQVKARHTTGVEMEALTAASVTALTIYDMLKAITSTIEIGPIKLLGKSGGKRDWGQVEFSTDEDDELV